MGSLVSSTIPSLISGVSQQPWNVRLLTQAEEQLNCYSSVVDFLKRRPATRHIARLFTPDECDPSKLSLHHINRDQQEQYIVVAGKRSLFVYDMQGRRKTVTLSQSGADYLDSQTERAFKFLTINDYTFILNTEKTVTMLPDISPAQPKQAFVFIKQASYNTTYTVTINATVFTFVTEDGIAPADKPADKLSSIEIALNIAEQINALPDWQADCTHSTPYNPQLASKNDSLMCRVFLFRGLKESLWLQKASIQSLHFPQSCMISVRS